MWDGIIGHQENKAFLEHMLQGERKTPSLLFYGPEGIGKKKMAQHFAKAFLCLRDPLHMCSCESCRAMEQGAHPDYLQVEPQGAFIVLSQIQNLVKVAAMAPVLSHYKECLIDQADKMNEAAQNSLLKLLEEPPAYWLFILVTDHVERLLPTIRSRVIQLHFALLTKAETQKVLELLPSLPNAAPGDEAWQAWTAQKKILASLAGGSVGKAVAMFQANALELRKELLEILGHIGQGDLLTFMAGIPLVLRSERQESLVILELLALLLRDGLVLSTRLTVPLYNEDLRGKLTTLFAKWPVEALRSALDMLQEARQGVGSFVNRRLVLEALFLQIGKEVAHGHHRGGPV